MKHQYTSHRIAVIFLSICCLVASAQISKNCDFSRLQYQYNDTTVNGMTYRTYFADGLTLSDSPGAPALPCKIYSFSVPYNATNIAIQLNNNFAQYSQLQNCTIMPAMFPKAMCDTTPEQILPDSVIYSANAYYPNNLAEITSEGYYMGENHIINVAVYPMQYNPATGMLKRYQNISFTITYNAGIDSLSNVMVSENITMRQRAWNEVKKFVDNPSQVESFAPTETAAQTIFAHNYTPIGDSIANYDSGLLASFCEYMIVTTQDLKPSFRRLAALKRQKGYTVDIKCVEDIVNCPMVQIGDRLLRNDGTYSCINDSAGKLRQFLRIAYAKAKTNYVLFGGRNVPFRYGCLSDTITKPQTIMDNNTPTDMYYTDLNSNWNIDGDSYYGEPDELDYGRTLDVFPELFVGRLVADSINQIENYTNKLLRYELNPGKGDGGYLKRVLITDGMVKGFKGVTPFLSNAYSTLYNDVTLIPSSSQPTAVSIINNINVNKYGIINIFGHGTPHNINVNERQDSLSTGSYLRSLQSMANKPHESGLDMLDNKYFPFVIYSESCTNMPYDIYEIYSHNWVFNKLNLGQSFTLGKDYGGVAYLGNTRYGTAKFDSYGPWYQTKIESFFIECLENGYSKVGVAEAISKQKYCISSTDNEYMPAFPHNLMGEPEFDIWTDEPTNYTGINISRNNNSITVSGISADSTIVAICDNNGDAFRKYSVNGSATFTGVSPNSTIMLYKHNYLPYIAPMYIQNAMIDNSQYIIAKDVYIGRDVDTNRTLGGVTIPSGVNYDMEFTGSINITGGFEVQKGAEFSVSLSDY